MMLLSHCPKRTLAGDGIQDAACNACAKQGGCPDVYTDRKGYRFALRRLKMEHGCVLRLYNSIVTDLSREIMRSPTLPLSLRLTFTDEDAARQCEIVASYRAMLSGGRCTHESDVNTTSGHWRRSVD